MVTALRTFIVTVLFLALSMGSPATAQDEPSILQGSSRHFPEIDVKAIRKVRCTGGHGTGFVISRGRLMTAYHVISGQNKCVDDETGRELIPIYWSYDLDIAVLDFKPGKREPKPLRIACSVYNTTGTFYSYGFAGVGFSDLMVTRLRAVDDYVDSVVVVSFPHMRALRGAIIQGMSGGPILNDRGRVIGMNNLTSGQYHFGLSREMRETYLCKR